MNEVLIQKLSEELAKQQPGQSNAVYVMAITMFVLCGGFIAAMKFLLGHTKEIHTNAQNYMLQVTDKHNATCETLADTFSENMDKCREMVHDARNIAETAVTAKEAKEKLLVSRDKANA